MNILQVNNFYPFTNNKGLKREQTGLNYYYGGQEAMILSLKQLLEAHGHRPVFFAMQHPDNLTCEHNDYFMPFTDLRNTGNIISNIKTAGRILYSFEARKRISRLLERYHVDIAHLHNISHHISPSILHEFKKRKIPVVMTLHHCKMVCASYYMLVNGKSCEDCYGGRYYMAIKNKCVRDSLLKSILCTLEMYLHHKILDIFSNVDIFISPSLFLKNKFKEMGFRREIVHLSNFVDIQNVRQYEELGEKNEEKENTIVYFGRLSFEKGLRTLIETASQFLHVGNGKKVEFKIIGEGPSAEELKGKVMSDKINNVRFLGYMGGKNLYREVKKSMAMVLPSECYENNPISILEAFALGIPVIGARIGGIPELVRDNDTGLTFEPGNSDDLTSKIRYLLNNPEETVRMGRNARSLVEGELSKEKHYEKLMEIYKYAMLKDSS